MTAKDENDAIKQTEWFANYERWFENLTEIKNLQKANEFKKKTEAERETQLKQEFYKKVLAKERDKFEFFYLAYGQKTLIVRAPEDIKDERAFLGYEKSTRRGNEGISLIKDINGKYQTALYDDTDLDNTEKLNYLVRQTILAENYDYKRENFATSLPIPTSMLENSGFYNLIECLDFVSNNFEKQISISPQRKLSKTIESKFQQITFSTIATLEYGSPLKESNRIEGDFPVMGSNGIVGYHNEFLIEAPSIIVGRKGSAGELNYIEKNSYPIDTTFYVVSDDKQVNRKFLFFLMKELDLKELGAGVGVPGLNRNDVHKLKIPLPPLDVQKKIVGEIEVVEREEETDRETIENENSKIQDLLKQSPLVKVRNTCTIGKGKAEPQDFDETTIYLGLEDLESNTGKLTSQQNALKSNVQSTKNVFKKDDVLYGKLRPYLNKVYLTEFEGVCSTDILVLKTDAPKLLKYALLDKNFVEQTSALMKGASLPRLKPEDFLNLKIHFPLDEQEKIVAAIEKHEAIINQAEARLATAAERKAAVLRKYL